MNIILILSLLIGFGFIFGKLASYIRLPSVSGYLIAGLLLGILNKFLPFGLLDNLTVFNSISEITLSFIAFGIGSEFVISDLKKSGKAIFIIALLEVIGAIGVVFLSMYVIVPLIPSLNNAFTGNDRFVFSLILGVMSAATAPAATIMVIRQFRTKGPVTDTILPVAALDDVLGIVAFGIALPIAMILSPKPGTVPLDPTLWNMIRMPVVEVLGSLVIGGILGFLLSLVSRKIDPRDELQVKTIFFVLIGLGVSMLGNEIGLGLSPLLVNIMIGATLANTNENASRSFRIINDFVPVFYILFFAIAGATLDITILKTVGIIGVVYVVARAAGKIVGAYSGAVISKAEPAVRKFLGFALLPQGGISIGLSILVQKNLPEHISTPIITIILFSILIYESTGPIFAKIALKNADELYKLDLVEDDLDLEDNMI